jgi:predicted HicB family RNase H-like nuclease
MSAKQSTPTSDQIKSTSIKMRESLHRELKVAAAREGRDMGELVEEALRAYLKGHRAAK